MVRQRRRRRSYQSRARTQQETNIQSYRWLVIVSHYLRFEKDLSLRVEPAKPAIDPNKSKLDLRSACVAGELNFIAAQAHPSSSPFKLDR